MDEQGRMDVTKDANNGAWYNLGYKPGEIGSAVIADHFNKPDGSPAIFYELTKLSTGDIITVEGSGQKLHFEVVKTQTYDVSTFPIKRVFERTAAAYLNLITCDGVFDKSKRSYNKWYIVYARLID